MNVAKDLSRRAKDFEEEAWEWWIAASDRRWFNNGLKQARQDAVWWHRWFGK